MQESPKAKQIPIEIMIAKLQQASQQQLNKCKAARALQDTKRAEKKVEMMAKAITNCKEAFVGMLGPTPPKAPPPPPGRAEPPSRRRVPLPKPIATPPKAAPPVQGRRELSPLARRSLRRQLEEAAGQGQ